jgi:hypothetical protein
MSSPGYTVESNGDIALTAATAKTVVSVINAANSLIRIVELGASFDGTSVTAEPVTVELCSCTQAGAGTSTAHTIVQLRGPTRTVQATGARNFTAEPTTITVLKRWLVHPAGLPFVIQFPLGREPEQTVTGDALLIRCTAPATVNVQAYLEFEEG